MQIGILDSVLPYRAKSPPIIPGLRSTTLTLPNAFSNTGEESIRQFWIVVERGSVFLSYRHDGFSVLRNAHRLGNAECYTSNGV